MADKYSTIQQHQPLRVPSSFDKYGRALVLQLDEIFDDIYRRFGRLKPSDFSSQLQNLVLIEDEDGKYVSVKDTVDGIETDIQEGLDEKISKTDDYGTADDIVSAAMNYTDGELTNYSTSVQTATEITNTVAAISQKPQFDTETAYAVGDIVAYEEKLYKFTTAHAAGEWDSTEVTEVAVTYEYSTTSQTAEMISDYVDNALGDYSTTAQTATEINMMVASISQRPVFSESTAYAVGDIVVYEEALYKFTSAHSAGAWDPTEVTEVPVTEEVYKKVSTIGITSSGIDISGGNYVRISANGSPAITIDATGIDMETAGRVQILALDASNSAIRFGSEASPNFAVGISGDLYAKRVTTDELIINGSLSQNIVVSRTQPPGNNIIWVRPDGTTDRQWVYTPSDLYLDSYTSSIGYYREYDILYAGDEAMSGPLYYGIDVTLIAFSLSSQRRITLTARLWDGTSWVLLGSVNPMVYSAFGTVNLNVMLSSTNTNVMSASGGNFKVRIETDYEPAKCRLTGSITFKARSTGSQGYEACSLFYLS